MVDNFILHNLTVLDKNQRHKAKKQSLLVIPLIAGELAPISTWFPLITRPLLPDEEKGCLHWSEFSSATVSVGTAIMKVTERVKGYLPPNKYEIITRIGSHNYKHWGDHNLPSVSYRTRKANGKANPCESGALQCETQSLKAQEPEAPISAGRRKWMRGLFSHSGLQHARCCQPTLMSSDLLCSAYWCKCSSSLETPS